MSEQKFFRLDSTGFPMIKIPTINGYVGFLPLTKIQIEYFVSSTNESMFDEAWYKTLLGYSGRISASQTNTANYRDLFVTGIMPREVQRVALWAGVGYNLMTSYEWVAVYDFVSAQNPFDNLVEAIETEADVALKPRVRDIFEALARNVRATTLADQMLLTNGIVDYVYADVQQTQFVGHGRNSMVLELRQPHVLANQREGARIKNFGSRLVYKG